MILPTPAALIILLLQAHIISQDVIALTTTKWLSLPHFERRDLLLSFPSLVTAISSPNPNTFHPRSISSIESHLAIPVWPSWGGGRVIPISMESASQDPFLLLAHHDHWFDPRDPLREPFKQAGKALGLPYVDVEGFSMHPHRGFDILTYVLDGSDGFRHRDSLGGTRTYKGGSAQWMRTGSGVLHEEFWETRSDRRTDIELFQLWVNLPAERKFDAPMVEYIGDDTEHPWVQKDILDSLTQRKVGTVRDLGATLDRATKLSGAMPRPSVHVLHATIDPGQEWTVSAPRTSSATLYVRKGMASLTGTSMTNVKAQQTATFSADGDFISIQNARRGKGKILDVLMLVGECLHEPVVQSGPIVMNTLSELRDAYRQLSDGTFLERDVVLRQQERNVRFMS